MLQAAAIACVFAIGMTALLDYFKFVSTTEGVLRSRMLVYGASIESSVQNALALGLPLAGNPALAALIGRERAGDPLIRDIDLFDSDGQIVYSTDAGRVGQPAPAAWRAAAREAMARPHWQFGAADQLGVGVGLQNNFGVTVGQLLIRYSRTTLERGIADMGASLLRHHALGLAVALAVLTAVLGVIFRRFTADLQNFEAGLVETLAADGRWLGDVDAHGMMPTLTGIGKVLADAHDGLNEVEHRLYQSESAG